MARNRIIYASQSVVINGEFMYRVQSLGTTTSFTSEDVFELGQLSIIDVVDDVPAVAVTMNTNDFGDVKTLAKLAQVTPAKADMSASAINATGNLVSGSDYMHGVCVADFAVTCGNLTGVTLWAPVQEECDLGTLADNIDQTLFLDEVYVNSLEFSYTTGANATENYGAETDNKMWLLNDGKFVSYLEATVTSGIATAGYLDLVTDLGYDATSTVPNLSTGNLAFLRKNADGAPAVTFYDESANTMTNIEVVRGDGPALTTFVFETIVDGEDVNRLWFPTTHPTVSVAEDDIIQMVFAADKYSTAITTNKYFEALDSSTGATRPHEVGALRQGQAEVYIVDPDVTASGTNYENAWRLTGVTLSADLTREPLTELGHLGPYDRPLTLPVPITVTVDSTAGDLENWAKMAGQKEGFDDLSLDDIDLTDLMTKDNLILVVKVFEQTDEEAGGTGSGRRINTPGMVGKNWFFDGDLNDNSAGQDTVYADGNIEYAMKTVIVKNLKITDEGMTLDVGANATQTFGFRANNDLFVVKGDISYDKVAGIARNATVV